MAIILISFLVAWLSTLLIVRFNHVHSKFSEDGDLQGVQKFHAKPTPRIGGVGIVLAFAITFMMLYWLPGMRVHGLGWVFVCALPAFLGGLVEDLTKRVGVLQRLFLTAFSGALGFILLGAKIDGADLFLFDQLLVFAPISFIFTCFAVSGVANSINLIDGYNGLASMVAILIFVALAYVGYQVGDVLVWSAALIMVGAVFGFFVWNYPRGLIFLGDGGAYLIGFMIAELSVLLLVRNPQVSCWFPSLLVFYPVFETLFTIYRRVVIRRASPGLPDAVHMHQMIYMRLVRWAVASKCVDMKTRRNSMTAPYLWTLSLVTVVPAMLLWKYELLLQIAILIFIALYVWLYWALVNFRAPRFLIRSSPYIFHWKKNNFGSKDE